MATTLISDREAALAAFLENMPEDAVLPARTLAHAWVSGGGGLSVGTAAVRLVAGEPRFTAGTLHAPRAGRPPRLELCRVILEKHGVPEAAWSHWSDDFVDLAPLGFDRNARFPRLELGGLGTPETARLATGLRDLARMAD